MQGYCLKLSLQLIWWVDSVAIRVRVFFLIALSEEIQNEHIFVYSYTYIILSLDFEFSFKLNISVEFLSLNLVDFYFPEILIFWPAWPSKIGITRIEKALIVPNICLESFLSFHSLAAPSLSSVVTKPTPTATSAYFQREQTTSPPNLESTRSSISSASSIADLTAIADLVPNTGELQKRSNWAENSLFCKIEEAKISWGQIRMKKHYGRWERCENIKYLLNLKGRDESDFKI